ncbi:hypothetical protein E4U21_002623 [Claviceps maximensis]|nr:hypothetical protein E4U21_002623 [Claviceps maximensis]
MSVNTRIDSWRHSVPSRLEREDPFENDGFQARCSTRFTFREEDHCIDIPKQTSRSSSFRSRISSLRKRRPRDDAHSAIETPSVHSHERYSVFDHLSHQLEDSPASAAPVCAPAPVPASEPTPAPRGERSRPVLLTKRMFGRKRARSPTPPPPALLIQEPVKLRFLFVGDHGSGQTALLYRAAFGYFPDTTAIVKTAYETYTLDKAHLPAQIEL